MLFFLLEHTSSPTKKLLNEGLVDPHSYPKVDRPFQIQTSPKTRRRLHSAARQRVRRRLRVVQHKEQGVLCRSQPTPFVSDTIHHSSPTMERGTSPHRQIFNRLKRPIAASLHNKSKMQGKSPPPRPPRSPPTEDESKQRNSPLLPQNLLSPGQMSKIPPRRPLPERALPNIPNENNQPHITISTPPSIKRDAPSQEIHEKAKARIKQLPDVAKRSSGHSRHPVRPSAESSSPARRSSEVLAYSGHSSSKRAGSITKMMKSRASYRRNKRVSHERKMENVHGLKSQASGESIGFFTVESLSSDQDDEDDWQSLVSDESPSRLVTRSSDYFQAVEQPQRRNYDPEDWVRPRYASGKIVTEPTFGLYAIPVLTAMDVLTHPGGATDDMVLDQIVDFFESYDFDPIVTTFDRFWEKDHDFKIPTRPKRPQANLSAYERVPSPLSQPTTPPTPTIGMSGFPFNSERHPTPLLVNDSQSAWSDSSSGKSAGIPIPTKHPHPHHIKRFSSAMSFFRGGNTTYQISHTNTSNSPSERSDKGSIRNFLSSPRQKEKRISQESSASIEQKDQSFKKPPPASSSPHWKPSKHTGTLSSGEVDDSSPSRSPKQIINKSKSMFKMPGSPSANNSKRTSGSTNSMTSSTATSGLSGSTEEGKEKQKKSGKLSLKKLAAKVDLSASSAYDVYG